MTATTPHSPHRSRLCRSLRGSLPRLRRVLPLRILPSRLVPSLALSHSSLARPFAPVSAHLTRYRDRGAVDASRLPTVGSRGGRGGDSALRPGLVPGALRSPVVSDRDAVAIPVAVQVVSDEAAVAVAVAVSGIRYRDAVAVPVASERDAAAVAVIDEQAHRCCPKLSNEPNSEPDPEHEHDVHRHRDAGQEHRRPDCLAPADDRLPVERADRDHVERREEQIDRQPAAAE